MKCRQVSRSRLILLLLSLLSAGRQAVGTIRGIDGGVCGGGGAGGAGKGLVAFAGGAQLRYSPLKLGGRRICSASIGCQSLTRILKPTTSSDSCLATQMLSSPNHQSMGSSLMNRINLNIHHERLHGSEASTKRMTGVYMRARGNVGAEGSGREGANVRKQEASIVSSSRPPREFEDEKLRLECAVEAKISIPSPVEFSGLLRVLADGAIRGGRWATVERAKEVTSIMERAGIRMDAESSNSLMSIMAEECWRGGGSIVDVEVLCDDCRNDELVEMNVQHYSVTGRCFGTCVHRMLLVPFCTFVDSQGHLARTGSRWLEQSGFPEYPQDCGSIALNLTTADSLLLECVAGLAHHGRASIEHGESLIEKCVYDGIDPDPVAWAGLLDIIVGMSRLGNVSVEEAEWVVGLIRASGGVEEATVDEWEKEIVKVVSESLRWSDGLAEEGKGTVGEGRGQRGSFYDVGPDVTWSEFRTSVKGKGMSQKEISAIWKDVKARRARAG